MKKSWMDFFRREYEIRMSVSGQDVTGSPGEQLTGISVNTPAGSGMFRDADKAAVNKTLSMLKDLHPDVLRIGSADPDAAFWLNFCLREEIHPHLVFPSDAAPEEIRGMVEACQSDFAENELRTPVRFYELSVDFSEISFSEDQTLEELIREMKEKAEQNAN